MFTYSKYGHINVTVGKEQYKEDIYFLGEYQIYFIECVENIRIFTSAQHG